jgi:hypothetical protein
MILSDIMERGNVFWDHCLMSARRSSGKGSYGAGEADFMVAESYLKNISKNLSD